MARQGDRGSTAAATDPAPATAAPVMSATDPAPLAAATLPGLGGLVYGIIGPI